jgi:enamidase
VTSRLILLFLVLCSFPSARSDDRFIAYPAGVTAIEGVTLLDGSGGPARTGQTVLLEQGRISAVGDTSTLALPQGATVIDGRGKSVLPGFVMLHEHMFYPTGDGNYTEMLNSFPKLYLAGGVTTLRTAGTMAPYADLKLRDAINRGEVIGPDMDVSSPHIDGPGLDIMKMHELSGVDEVERMVNYWADEGVTSWKAYMHLTRDELGRVIEIAHNRQQKVTGHLCSITYREAAGLGIDNLEHGFLVASDFVVDKQPDQCPPGTAVLDSLAALDLGSSPVRQLIEDLVEKGVAITSTLTVFETFAPGRPRAWPEALDLLIPQVRAQYEARWAEVAEKNNENWTIALQKGMALEKMFVAAGGQLLVGTDPTGYGGVIAGYSSLRAIELLREAGFALEQAVSMATLNGARYLGREGEIGLVKAGHRADLIMLEGDVSKDPAAIRHVSLVFHKGVAYDSREITRAMAGTVGLH